MRKPPIFQHLAAMGLVLGFVAAICQAGYLTAIEDAKTSTWAPSGSLEEQVDTSLAELKKGLAKQEDYNLAKQAKVKKEANLLVVVLMALGQHDEKNRFQASAPALVDSAEMLVQGFNDYAKAQAALTTLEQGIQNGANGGKPLKWEKRYKLGLLMKQVTMLQAKLRRGLRGDRFEKDAQANARYAATLAAIAEATRVDTHEVKKEQDLPTWNKLATEWRDLAGEVGRSIQAKDQKAAEEALKRMTQSCSDCHSAFRIGGL